MIDIFSEEIVLENQLSKLVPLTCVNGSRLAAVCYDEDIWTYMGTSISDETALKGYIEKAVDQRDAHLEYPFVVIDKRGNKVAGSTRYGLVNQDCHSLEIGWTWYGKDFRGTGLNLACKHLLLDYAFEQAGVNRVTFSAAPGNLRSQKAIRKIGGHYEGTQREVLPHTDGTYHDLAVFSILRSEWPRLNSTIFSEFVT